MTATADPHRRFVQILRRTVAAPESDAALLARFVESRDEAAFAAIIERHGSLVLGVCRRMLGDCADAEDAFQAVFLALVRSGRRIRKGESLASWLYGAACRVCQKARRSRSRIRTLERKATRGHSADPLAEISVREFLETLDDELARLPGRLRLPLVLCLIEGLSQNEAAARLGCSPGSIKGRLERGREKLRRRLSARGVTLAAALSAAAVGSTNAAVPPDLFARAATIAAGKAVPMAVAKLASAAVHSSAILARISAAILLAAAISIAAMGGGQQPEPKPAAEKPDKPAKATARVDRFGDPLPEGALMRLGTTRLRHANVYSVMFTDDGKLSSFGRDYNVRTWEVATGKQLFQREFEKEQIQRFWGGCLSSDAKLLAMQHLDTVKVFEVATGRELMSVKLVSAWEAMASFSPDGKSLAVVDQDVKTGTCKVQVCDLPKNSCSELGKVSGFHTPPTFSRDGKRLAIANYSQGVVVWDVATKRVILNSKSENQNAGAVDFDPSGDIIAILGTNPHQSLRFARVSTGKPPRGWSAPSISGFDWVRFSPDGSTILLGGQDQPIHWLDPKTGKFIRQAAGGAFIPPAFSRDGKLLASAGRNALEIWDAGNGNSAVPKFLGDIAKDEIQGVAVSPDGKWFLTKTADSGTIQNWDSAGQMKGTIKSNRWGGRYPIFSRDSRHFYSGAPDTIALIRCDFPSGLESSRYTFAEPAADQVAILNLGMSVDGARLAAISQTVNRPGPGPAIAGGGNMGAQVVTITVWDAATTKRLSSREIQNDGYFGYGAFSPDLRRYYLNDRAIALDGGPGYKLDLPAGGSASQAAVSPDGRLVAQMLEANVQKLVNGQPSFMIEPHGVIVHETATGKGLFTLPTGYCSQIAFSPDSRDLIVVGKESIVRWDLTTQKPIVRHQSPGRFVGSYGPGFASSLTISPDGAKAITGHIDTTALVWDMSAPRRIAKALSDREREAAWNDLAGTDAGKAYAAIWALEGDAERSVAFLKARLRPAVAPKTDHVLKLIARLGVESFADREAAEKELRTLGELTIPNLRAALKSSLPAEQKRRLERLLAEATSPVVFPGDRLQQVRAVAVLEHLGSKEAVGLLKELAGGLPEARLTREAAEALGRLDRIGHR